MIAGSHEMLSKEEFTGEEKEQEGQWWVFEDRAEEKNRICQVEDVF